MVTESEEGEILEGGTRMLLCEDAEYKAESEENDGRHDAETLAGDKLTNTRQLKTEKTFWQ